MSKREIAAAAAKKYILSATNTTASAPADRYHSVITLITLGKAEEGENINREKHGTRRPDTNQPLRCLRAVGHPSPPNSVHVAYGCWG